MAQGEWLEMAGLPLWGLQASRTSSQPYEAMQLSAFALVSELCVCVCRQANKHIWTKAHPIVICIREGLEVISMCCSGHGGRVMEVIQS